MRRKGAIIAILLCFVFSNEAIGKSDITLKRYNYLELQIIRSVIIKDYCVDNSTTIIVNDGKGKEISITKTSKGENDKNQNVEAFNGIIEAYTGKKFATESLSEIFVLNALGDAGWEIIIITDNPAIIRDGNTYSNTKYMFKKEVR